MAFKNKSNEIEVSITEEEFNAQPYHVRRASLYREACDDDIGKLYDMIDKLKAVLEANSITVDFGNDQSILDHRAAVKAAHPKPSE